MKKVMMAGLFTGCALVYGQQTTVLDAGQDSAVQAKLNAETFARVTNVRTTLGAVVKGAPYSGVETTETTQVLGDGTRIHNETQVHVYRDSAGRVRREQSQPDGTTSINIWDPVAQAGYHLDPVSQTATKLPYGGTTTLGRSADGQVFFYTTSDGGSAAAAARKLVGEKIALEATQSIGSTSGNATNVMYAKVSAAGKEESLGTQVIEGVQAEGKRVSNRIEAGVIGNDRPIDVVNERWYSPDLSITVKMHRSDPRTGDETFRVTNILRGEPSADLFQVPSGYQIRDRK